MKIPWSDRKKALVIVDVQQGFLNERNKYIIEAIKILIQNAAYDFYIESIFYAEKGSLWDMQTNWTLPKDKNSRTISDLLNLLSGKSQLHIEKQTKSIFKGTSELHNKLQKIGIEEVHIVGLDANDCVLATAFEAFDLGYFTYVIEECTDSSSSEEIKETGFEILRHVNLTNNSCIEHVSFKEI
jgi:nicotinamidase-related amidase